MFIPTNFTLTSLISSLHDWFWAVKPLTMHQRFSVELSPQHPLHNHALIWGVLGTPLVCSPSGEFGLHGLQGVQGGAPDPRVGPLLPLWGWVSQTIKKTITTYLEAWRCLCWQLGLWVPCTGAVIQSCQLLTYHLPSPWVLAKLPHQHIVLFMAICWWKSDTRSL